MRSRTGTWLWRLRRIEAVELLMIAEAQIALLTCQIAKWARPVGQLLTTAENETSSVTRRDIRKAVQVGWAVDRAARFGVFRPQCLVRSLAVQRMLRRRRMAPGELRIGVRRNESGLLAHAWIEIDGVVIGDYVQYVRTFTPAPDLKLVEL